MSHSTDKLISFIRELLRINQSFPINYALAFLVICQNEGLSQNDVGKIIKLTPSTVSRIVQKLSGEDSYQLIKINPDPKDRRRKNMFLTDHGKLLYSKIKKII